MPRHVLLALVVAGLLLAGCGGAEDDSGPSIERFCGGLSAANNNDAFVNLHNQYFTDWPEITALLDGAREFAPPDIAEPLDRLGTLVEQIAAADRDGGEGDPVRLLSSQDQADLAAATAAVDAYAAANCGFQVRQ